MRKNLRHGTAWFRHPLSLTFALAVSGTIAVHAQTTGASVNGTVRDSTGAVIRSAEISATEAATAAHSTAHTNAQGEYTLLGLAPGTYSLDITAPGYGAYQQNGVRLDVGQHATQDVALSPGGVQQTVTVNADVSTLNTTSSVVSDEVDGASLRDLPLNTRNPYALVELVPGFTGSTGDDYNSNSFSIDGGRQGYTDVFVDGTLAGFQPSTATLASAFFLPSMPLASTACWLRTTQRSLAAPPTASSTSSLNLEPTSSTARSSSSSATTTSTRTTTSPSSTGVPCRPSIATSSAAS